MPLGRLADKYEQVEGQPEPENNGQEALEEGLFAFDEIRDNLNCSS